MRKHQWGIVLSQKELPEIVRKAFPDGRQPHTWVDGTYLLQCITYDPITDAQVALLKVAPLSAHGICSLSCSSEEVPTHASPGRMPDDASNPCVLQIHDPLQSERTISLIIRHYPNHVMLEAYPRLKATDEPWFDALGAIGIAIYDNKIQVLLYDRVGIATDTIHWRLPDGIGKGSFVLAENVDENHP